jgi:hypothetical protein
LNLGAVAIVTPQYRKPAETTSTSTPLLPTRTASSDLFGSLAASQVTDLAEDARAEKALVALDANEASAVG